MNWIIARAIVGPWLVLFCYIFNICKHVLCCLLKLTRSAAVGRPKSRADLEYVVGVVKNLMPHESIVNFVASTSVYDFYTCILSACKSVTFVSSITRTCLCVKGGSSGGNLPVRAAIGHDVIVMIDIVGRTC